MNQQTDGFEDELNHDSWAAALRENQLLGQECESCGYTTATPKAACVRCSCRNLSTVELHTEGTVYSESTVSVPPKGFENQYQVALINLGDNTARILGRIDGSAEIGDEVVLKGARDSDGMPAPIFELI